MSKLIHKNELDFIAPTNHYFSDGVYCRVMFIPANHFVVGAKHLTRHLNVLLKGKMLITIGSETRAIEGPYIFEALEESVKAVLTYTECQFMNIHPTDTTDMQELEKELVDYDVVTDAVAKNLLKTLKENICLLES